MQDRRWIGQSGCFKEHTPEFAAAIVEVAQQRFEARRRGRRASCSTGSRTAATPYCRRHTSTSRWSSDDLAELVDDDGGLREGGILQQPVEQCGLAGAEEAGQDWSSGIGVGGGWRSLSALAEVAHCVDRGHFRLWPVFAGLAVPWPALPASRSLSGFSALSRSPPSVLATAFFLLSGWRLPSAPTVSG